jgi:hypothetical protein
MEISIWHVRASLIAKGRIDPDQNRRDVFAARHKFALHLFGKIAEFRSAPACPSVNVLG